MQDFSANSDRDTVVFHELKPPTNARFVRFLPEAWQNHISMRVELYGCLDGRQHFHISELYTELFSLSQIEIFLGSFARPYLYSSSLS